MIDYCADSSVYHAPVLGRKNQKDSFEFYGKMVSCGKDRYALDGAGIVDKELVVESSDLLKVKKDFDYFGIKGSLSIYSEEIRRGVTVLKINPDPIGACLIYKYAKDGVVGFSSDLKHLADWLASQGIKVEKSAFYQAMLLSIGDGAFGYTSYENIFALESSKYIVAYKNQYSIIDYGVEDFLKGDDSYENLLDLAEKDIQDTLDAIHRSKFEKISHLTGGMDSRLVVAAISSTGKLDDYKIFCSGQHGYPDFDTAYSLCSVINARMTNKQSLMQERVPANFKEYYQWSSSDNSGILPNQPTNTGMSGSDDSIILSGGYGECLRGYYLHCADQSLNSVIENIWPLCNDQGNVRVPVKESVVKDIRGNLGTYLLSKLEKGWNLNEALQLLYLQEKNRYFVGNITLSYSRYTPRIDPLYSLFAFKAAYKIDFEDRANKMLMFDLMRRFDERLVKIRFGTTSWPEKLINKKKIDIEDFPKNRNVAFERHEPKANIDWLTKVSGESKREAIRLGAPAWQVHNYRNIQNLSKEILAGHPEFFESFDKVRTMRLLNNVHNNRQNIRKVFQFYYSLVWLYT